ncbi:MAG: NAD(P)H-hydrate epimerase [Phycisphaeraceae bacterium]|nr:MAG: NAD(P)H-hydrate epimerase [Phycisphaeraceae bacterium]
MKPPARPDRRQLVFRRAGIRAVDEAAIQKYGIPGVALMENAATALRDACLPRLDGADPLALIVTGPGNNGGDGLALARRLDNEHVRTATVLARSPDRYEGDAATNLRIVERMGLPLFIAGDSDPTSVLDAAVQSHGEPTMIVDAIFGTGLDRPMREPYPAIVSWINERGRGGVDIVAVDIPSGLDCDTGRPLGTGNDSAVRADLTVTLAGMKIGFFEPGASAWTGEVIVGDIGAPRELLEQLAVGSD